MVLLSKQVYAKLAANTPFERRFAVYGRLADYELGHRAGMDNSGRTGLGSGDRTVQTLHHTRDDSPAMRPIGLATGTPSATVAWFLACRRFTSGGLRQRP